MDRILRMNKVFLAALFAPASLFVGGLILLPLVGGIYLSFTDASPLHRGINFIGWGNYTFALGDRVFWEVIANTLIIVIGSIAVSTLIAFVLALALESRLRFAGFYKTGIFQVWVIPWITVAVVWSWLFNEEFGIVNDILVGIGVIESDVNWFARNIPAKIAIMSGFAWRSVPLIMVISLAALQTVPKECLEAARVDGLTYLQRLRHIVLPLVKNSILVIALLQSVRLFQEITLPFIVTQGGPGNATTTLAIYSYKIAFQQWDYGLSAAVSTIWMAIVLVFSIFYVRLLAGRGAEA